MITFSSSGAAAAPTGSLPAFTEGALSVVKNPPQAHIVSNSVQVVAGETLAKQAHAKTTDPSDFPLHHAAIKGMANLLRILLMQIGKEVNSIDTKGYTPLMYAVSTGKLNVSEVLLENGARIDPANHVWKTILKSTAKNHLALYEILQKHMQSIKLVKASTPTTTNHEAIPIN